MKKKTWVALLLVSLLTISGVASAEGFWKQNLISEEPLELTFVVGRFSLDASTSYADKAFMQGLEEATNIKINWIEISETSSEALNAILNSGDLPDAFVGLLSDDIIVQNSSLFLPLNDLLDEYAPNTMAFYNEFCPYWKSYTTFPDGNIYGIMGSFLPKYDFYQPCLPFINKSWLERLNLEMPTTLEELTDVLMAFREQDANGNGDPHDEIPMSFCNNHWNSQFMQLSAAFGLPYVRVSETQHYLFDIQDGKVKATVNTQAFRDFLTWASKATSEGLINAEGFSMTEEQYFAELDAGRVGMFWGWMPGTFISNKVLQDEYVAFTPVAAKGYQVRISADQAVPNRHAFVISSSSQHAKECLQVWDYLSQSEASKLLVAYGPEGTCYKWYDDLQKYALYTPTDEEMIAAGYGDYVGSQGTSKFYGSFGLINYHPVTPSISFAQTTERDNGQAIMQRFINNEYMNRGVVPADAQEELDFATDGLYNAIFESTANFVLKGVTDESWTTYLQKLDTYGYDFYIDWYQRYLDEKF